MIKDIFKKLKLYGFNKFFRYSVAELSRLLYWNLLRGSYSQKQEDLIIDKLTGNKKIGFYIDIGASDPNRFNNTKRFYERGWSGINVEPNVVLIDKINEARKRDINLNIGIGNSNNKTVFYVFYPDTLSTFSRDEADEYLRQGFKVEKETEVELRSLKDVLDQYAKGKEVDFLTIDTEGNDLTALQSNDWNIHRPTLLCVEMNTHGGSRSGSEPLQKYLESIKYEKVHDNGLNAIYLDKLSRRK